VEEPGFFNIVRYVLGGDIYVVIPDILVLQNKLLDDKPN